MSVLFDARVAAEILGSGTEFEDCFVAYDVAQVIRQETYFAFHELPIFERLLMEMGQTQESCLEKRAALMRMFTFVAPDGQSVRKALRRSRSPAVVALSECAALYSGCDLIVSLDSDAYKETSVWALTPKEFRDKYTPEEYVYSFFEL